MRSLGKWLRLALISLGSLAMRFKSIAEIEAAIQVELEANRLFFNSLMQYKNTFI